MRRLCTTTTYTAALLLDSIFSNNPVGFIAENTATSIRGLRDTFPEIKPGHTYEVNIEIIERKDDA